MREYRVTTALGLPIVTAVITGPKASARVQLIFDTGAYMSQVNQRTLTALGFAFHDRVADLMVKGVTGPGEQGFSVELSRLFTLGVKFQGVTFGAFDFTDWVQQGIDGLLGWDIIKQLHVELDGPEGLLKVF